MKRIFLLLLSLSFVLCAVDYDCIFIGTSPIPLMEAIYQSYLGKKVLILEQANECGGAWKSLSICGVPHADLGCHDQTWNSPALTEFFEQYIGCTIVPFTNPLAHHSTMRGGTYWFSKGCFELIQNLLKIISKTSIDLRTNHRIDQVSFHPVEHYAIVSSEGERFTTQKIYVTPLSSFSLDQCPSTHNKTKFCHLYLLVADPTPPKFISGYLGNGASRVMNLTFSSELANSGRQLIVLQTNNEQEFNQGQKFIDLLKTARLLDPSAYILQAEPYIYETCYRSVQLYQLPPLFRSYFELLNTSSLGAISLYLPKWKQVFKPYKELFP